MADLRITKTEHTEREDNRNEPSVHTSDVGASGIPHSTHRGLLLMNHSFHIQTSREVGSRREAMHAAEMEDRRNQFGDKQSPNRYCQEIEQPGVTTGGSIYDFS